MGDHRLLHRVQRAIGACDTFDGAHRFAVDLRQHQDAGIQRARALCVGDHHRAGTAIALGAAFLGPGEPAIEPQIIQNCAVGRKTGADLLAAMKEAHGSGAIVDVVRG
ncbi:hypothetical protein GALL_527070 [mine drainage metagenome]|uniref:Uncharacterized protein n=1 Tax=mine drainage metagenome TaxID=410659 RepID=A0A1J5P2E2_9ZZZZ